MTETLPQQTDFFSAGALASIKKQADELASKYDADWALVFSSDVKGEWRVVFTPRRLDEVES